jgi:hypothetical protein
LPSATSQALGKEPSICRVPTQGHSAKTPSRLLSFAECPLPSVTLGKAFAECNEGFAECPGHSAKGLNPVVGRLGIKVLANGI